jgi:putative transposase
MSNYIRATVPGACYFFTVALADRQSNLLLVEIERLRSAYKTVAHSHPFETVAICILPDHIHAIWRMPLEDSDFSVRWRLIKQRFSVGLPAVATSTSKRGKREKGIWQRRFWEHLTADEDDLARHIDYTHFNPVKHGLVQQVKDWPHSSFHRWVRQGRLHPDWGMALGAAREDLAGGLESPPYAGKAADGSRLRPARRTSA